MNKPEAIACRGRPREFCTDKALTEALRVFWSKGYEGTSLTDLTEAMGITRPSLYAAFGNKEALFRQALDLYERDKLAYVGASLEKPTAREVVESMLLGAVANMTGQGQPHGCLGVITSVACGGEAEGIREDVLERGKVAKEEGDLPSSADPVALTNYVYTVIQGMSVQAGSGAPREELERTVDMLLAMWPSK